MTNDERHKHLDEARHVLETWPDGANTVAKSIIEHTLHALRRALILAEEARDLETNGKAEAVFDCACCGTTVEIGHAVYRATVDGFESVACCRGCLESPTFVVEG